MTDQSHYDVFHALPLQWAGQMGAGDKFGAIHRARIVAAEKHAGLDEAMPEAIT